MTVICARNMDEFSKPTCNLLKTKYDCVQATTTLRFADFGKKIFFSDDAYLGGYINQQNCRTWGTENPHAYFKKPTHTKRVTV